MAQTKKKGVSATKNKGAGKLITKAIIPSTASGAANLAAQPSTQGDATAAVDNTDSAQRSALGDATAAVNNSDSIDELRG